jgi:hypothetical protein
MVRMVYPLKLLTASIMRLPEASDKESLAAGIVM